jgi:DNA-3-methyladenine glycosylase I
MSEPDRCPWATNDPLLERYHDEEWGVPVRDDRDLFAKLVLDGQQAGLSWLTILRKREGYEAAFHGFDPEVMAGFGEDDLERLLEDPEIIRNRQKITSAIRNARAFLDFQEEEPEGFGAFLWGFVDGEPIVNRWTSSEQLPARTERSARMAKALKERGFSFVGPTICYAFMQAVGMVNDHLVSCRRHGELAEGAGS